MRARTMRMCSVIMSQPTKWYLSRTAAIPVVPLPVTGSSTVPPGGVTSRTSQRITAIGLNVACPSLWIFAPQSPQTLPLHNLANVAGAATPIEWPSTGREIEVIGTDGLSLSAAAARLDPRAIDEHASSMDSLVFRGGDESEVFQPVVSRVLVDVMELPSGRDGCVCKRPHNNGLQPQPPAECSAQVSSGGDVTPIGARRLWTSFTHAGIVPVSQWQVKYSHRSG